MDKKTLSALKGSIRKWEKIVAGTGKDLGVMNCPLCALFYGYQCKGCPVQKKTGRTCCDGTPYRNGKLGELTWAKAELKFLRGLLPVVRKTKIKRNPSVTSGNAKA